MVIQFNEAQLDDLKESYEHEMENCENEKVALQEMHDKMEVGMLADQDEEFQSATN